VNLIRGQRADCGAAANVVEVALLAAGNDVTLRWFDLARTGRDELAEFLVGGMTSLLTVSVMALVSAADRQLKCGRIFFCRQQKGFAQ